MEIKDFQNARVTVMGLGLYKQGSGMGATKWLIRHGAQTIITDLKTEEELTGSVREVMFWFQKYHEDYPDRKIHKPVFILGKHQDDNFSNADFVIQNPGVPKESKYIAIAQNNNVPIETDISLFFRFCPQPIIGITGTKGKSTTTQLLGAIFLEVDPRTVVGGNIKVSPLEYLDSILDQNEAIPIILELSSWQLESLVGIEKNPHIAVLTNIFPDHLNRYGGSYTEYQKSKAIIFNYQNKDDVAIVNRTYPESKSIGDAVPSKRLWFQIEEFPEENGIFVRGDKIVFRLDGDEREVIDRSELGMGGEHNLENSLAAVGVAMISDVPLDVMQKVLKEFDGVADRQEIVREYNGVTYVNDTTATTPEATIAALKRFSKNKNVVLIAGGASKDLSYDHVADSIVEMSSHVILLEGIATPDLAKSLGGRIDSSEAKSMKEAVAKAHQIAKEGDVVLMSPASSSFGMFRNEFERGQQFRDEVAGLG